MKPKLSGSPDFPRGMELIDNPELNNNVYIFPAVGLGVVASGARRVTDGMMLAAAGALAETSPTLKNPNASLLPALADLRGVAIQIATAVGLAAQKDGVAPKVNGQELSRRVKMAQWTPVYSTFAPPTGMSDR